MTLPTVENPTPLPDPYVSPRKRYTFAKENVNNRPGTWDSTQVTVLRDGEPIYEYKRSYSMLHTFEPFRQLQGDRWHDYALISPRYTTFQVLDLESCEVVAERPYPEKEIPAEWFERNPNYFEEGGWLAGKKPGDMMRMEGFCPVEFFVPDAYDGSYLDEDEGLRTQEDIEKYRHYKFFEDDVQAARGNFGFYSGCIWGDDGSWKLRGIDLSRISEGIVTDDERFGYWELPSGRLRDLIHIDGTYCTVSLSVPVNVDTGKASKWTRENVNWNEVDEDDTW